MNWSVLTLISAVGVLSGCVTQPPDTAPSVSSLIAQQTSDIDREIADANLYAGVLEPIAVRQVVLKNPDYVTDEALLRIVNAEFTGKIEDLVSIIARDTNYSVIADGEKPGAPIVIVLAQRDLPALGALREGFHQAKGRAKLFVDQASRTMTIHYRRHENSPVPHQEDLEV